MEDTFKTRQLTEYKTLSDGRSGCLFYVEPKALDNYSQYSYTVSTIYLLKSSCRENDKAPFVDGLHETEKQQLTKKEPLLVGYPAWVAAIRLTTSPEDKIEVNSQVYRDALAKIGGKEYYSIYEYDSLKNNKKIEAEYEELFGKEDWSYIKYKWGEGVNKIVSERYKNKSILTEDGRLDYAKALFDLNPDDDFENEYRRIRVEYNKRLEMSIWGAMVSIDLEKDYTPYMDDNEREWKEEGLTEKEMEEKCEELYDEESSLYHASGFIAALINLARNKAIYEYATGFKWKLYGPNLEIDKLRFDFNIPTIDLCEKYLQQVEDYYKRQEAMKPEVLGVDVQQIDLRILSDERRYSRVFFEYTKYPHLISEWYLKTLKTYSQTFQTYLVSQIGFDPDDEKKSQAEKESQAPNYAFVIKPHQTEEIIKIILSYLEGKSSPKDVMMPIRAACDAGVIRKPTYEEVKMAFPNYCPKCKSSVNNYTNPDNQPYIGEAYQKMIEEFKKYSENGLINGL